MKKKPVYIIKNAIIFFIAFSLLLCGYGTNASSAAAGSAGQSGFYDVPADNWAYGIIMKARQSNITQGIGNNIFGLGLTVKRSEFAKFLISIMGWELSVPDAGSFEDNEDRNAWYYPYVETALAHGLVSAGDRLFRPRDDITREEMAVMIVKALGYQGIANSLNSLEKPFADVTSNTGYITMVKDMGIVTGKTSGGSVLFDPTGSARREEAIAMLVRLYDRLKGKIDDLHAFYAISSYSQIGYLDRLDSVGFGWSSLVFDPDSKNVVLSTNASSESDYYMPEDYKEPLSAAKTAGAESELMVYASQQSTVDDGSASAPAGLVEYALSDAGRRSGIIDAIIAQLNGGADAGNGPTFDGVVIDFENLQGPRQKNLLNIFLTELKPRLGTKKLFVAVHPVRKPGQPYYDGYDYRTIGVLADKVILMAHDYYSTILTQQEQDSGYNDTPLSPVDEVYYALKAITDKSTGVSDTKKIILQISFDTVQWKKQNGRIINRTAFRPGYDLVLKRLQRSPGTLDLKMNYHSELMYAWATFANTEDGTENIIWYEDSRSALAKVKLASMFGINGISLWRLGNIPSVPDNGDAKYYMDVWQQLLNLRGK